MTNPTPPPSPRAADAATMQRIEARLDAMQLNTAAQLEASNKATNAAVKMIEAIQQMLAGMQLTAGPVHANAPVNTTAPPGPGPQIQHPSQSGSVSPSGCCSLASGVRTAANRRTQHVVRCLLGRLAVGAL